VNLLSEGRNKDAKVI